MASEVAPSLVEYLQSCDLRYLQERRIGIDLYNSGYLGVTVACLFVASATVFALSLFQVIPKRRHVVTLLLGFGVLSTGIGFLTTSWNFDQLVTDAERLVSTSAGPEPATLAQEAAVISLPLLLGAGNCVFNLLGCLYMAVFWSGRLLPKSVKQRQTIESA